MKLGFVSDSLAHLGLEEVLETAAELGLDGVEVNTGNWSSAPHFDMNRMKSSADARKAFTEAFASRGLKLIALNANGNQLHPVTGVTQSRGHPVRIDAFPRARSLGREIRRRSWPERRPACREYRRRIPRVRLAPLVKRIAFFCASTAHAVRESCWPSVVWQMSAGQRLKESSAG